MNGRWTITKGGDDVRLIRGPECPSTPVVPVDDAAVERAARNLAGVKYEPTEADMRLARITVAIVVEGLRAAGEVSP